MSSAAHVHPADLQPVAGAQAGAAAGKAGAAATASNVLIIVGAVAGGVIALTTAITLAVMLTRPATVCEGLSTGECTASLAVSANEVVAGCDQDVGVCSSLACNSCDMCCGAAFESQTADCSGETVTFSKVVSCSCVSCSAREVAISGKVAGDCTSGSTCAASIRVNGVEVTQSNAAGYFTFRTTHPGDGTVNFQVVADTATYFPQSQSVQVSETSQSYVNIQVAISQLGTPTVIDGTAGGTVTTTDFDIAFPANGFTTADGTPFTGNVNIYINALQPSNAADADTISVTMTSPSGDPFFSNGMFTALATSAADPTQALQASGVSFTSTTDIAPSLTSYLWRYNDNSGGWVLVTDATRQVRLSRDGKSFKTVTTVTLDLSTVPQSYNIDAVVSTYCYMQVRLLVNGQGGDGTVTTVYYKGSDWVLKLDRYSRENGKVCAQVPCSRDPWPAEIVHVQATGFTVGTPVASDGVLTEMTYTPQGNTAFRITIPATGDIPIAESAGPFYRTWSQCNANSENYFIFSRTSTVGNDTNSTSSETAISFDASLPSFVCSGITLGAEIAGYFHATDAVDPSAYGLLTNGFTYNGASVTLDAGIGVTTPPLLNLKVYSSGTGILHTFTTNGTHISYVGETPTSNTISGDGITTTAPDTTQVTVVLVAQGTFTIGGGSYSQFALGTFSVQTNYVDFSSNVVIVPGLTATSCRNYVAPTAESSEITFNASLPSFLCSGITLGAEIAGYFHPTDAVDPSAYGLLTNGFTYNGASVTLDAGIGVTTPPLLNLKVFSSGTGILHTFTTNGTHISYAGETPTSNTISGDGITATAPDTTQVTVVLVAQGSFTIGGGLYSQFALGNFTVPADYEAYGSDVVVVPGLTATGCFVPPAV